MKYFVYILKSRVNQRHYTGSTNNLQRRLKEHNSGSSKYTRFTKPFDLVYYEEYPSRSDAVRRERYLKTGKGREEVKKILAGL